MCRAWQPCETALSGRDTSRATSGQCCGRGGKIVRTREMQRERQGECSKAQRRDEDAVRRQRGLTTWHEA